MGRKPLPSWIVPTSLAAAGVGLGMLLVSVLGLVPNASANSGDMSIPRSAAVQTVDLSRFDEDLYPPIDVSHRVPAVVRAGDDVQLEFMFACGYFVPGDPCEPKSQLWVGYGTGFAPIPLQAIDRDTLEVFTATVPAIGANGGSLRYFLTTDDVEKGVHVRFPTAGNIAPHVAHSLIKVELGTAIAEPGIVALSGRWGSAADEFGIQEGKESSTLGPEAIDVTPAGDALVVLDGMNRRVVVQELDTGRRSTFPIQAGLGDITIDQNRSVAILDSIGQTSPDGPSVPHIYVYSWDGELISEAPVYTRAASHMGDDRGIVGIDERQTSAIGADGQALSRDQQRRSATEQTLRVYFRHDGRIMLSDSDAGIAFEVTADDEIGPIAAFERTQSGYVLAFARVGATRIAWFNSDGSVVRYVTTPTEWYAEANPEGYVAVSQSGDVYVLNSAREGIDIRMVGGSE